MPSQPRWSATRAARSANWPAVPVSAGRRCTGGGHLVRRGCRRDAGAGTRDRGVAGRLGAGDAAVRAHDGRAAASGRSASAARALGADWRAFLGFFPARPESRRVQSRIHRRVAGRLLLDLLLRHHLVAGTGPVGAGDGVVDAAGVLPAGRQAALTPHTAAESACCFAGK
ncbi:hypothetical protein G6F63_014718 [Rhizopus arrhizus]|nr:hypothetical protein G6F63_014718 [Rhizopus arrhizus]